MGTPVSGEQRVGQGLIALYSLAAGPYHRTASGAPATKVGGARPLVCEVGERERSTLGWEVGEARTLDLSSAREAANSKNEFSISSNKKV